MKTSKYWNKYGPGMALIDERAKTVQKIFSKLMEEAKSEIDAEKFYMPYQIVGAFERANKKWNKIVELFYQQYNTDGVSSKVCKDDFLNYVKAADPDMFAAAELQKDIEKELFPE